MPCKIRYGNKLYTQSEFFDYMMNNTDEFSEYIFGETISEETQNELLDKMISVFKGHFPSLNVTTDWNTFIKNNSQFAELHAKNGTVYGAKSPDGTMYLNKDFVNSNTPIHEFSHLWEQLNPIQFKRGVDLLKETESGKKLFEDLKNEGNYGTDENVIWNEALNQYIGNYGEYKTNKQDKGVLDWIRDFFKSIGLSLGIDNLYPEFKMANFADKVVKQMTGLSEMSVEEVRGEDTTNYNIIGEKTIEGHNDDTLKAKLNKARRMEALGYHIDEIFYETGFERTDEGFWSYEIKTSDVKFNKTGEKIDYNRKYPLSKLLKYDELFKFFPKMVDYDIVLRNPYSKKNMSTNGSFSAGKGLIEVMIGLDDILTYNSYLVFKEMEKLDNFEELVIALSDISLSHRDRTINELTKDDSVSPLVVPFLKKNNLKTIKHIGRLANDYKYYILDGTKSDYKVEDSSNVGISISSIESSISTLLHEIQHYIQAVENWEGGHNSAYSTYVMTKEELEEYNRLEKLSKSKLTPEDKKREYRNELYYMRYNLYRRNAGEVQSRNVQNRYKNKNQTQPLYTTEDIERSKHRYTAGFFSYKISPGSIPTVNNKTKDVKITKNVDELGGVEIIYSSRLTDNKGWEYEENGIGFTSVLELIEKSGVIFTDNKQISDFNNFIEGREYDVVLGKTYHNKFGEGYAEFYLGDEILTMPSVLNHSENGDRETGESGTVIIKPNGDVEVGEPDEVKIPNRKTRIIRIDPSNYNKGNKNKQIDKIKPKGKNTKIRYRLKKYINNFNTLNVNRFDSSNQEYLTDDIVSESVKSTNQYNKFTKSYRNSKFDSKPENIIIDTKVKDGIVSYSFVTDSFTTKGDSIKYKAKYYTDINQIIEELEIQDSDILKKLKDRYSDSKNLSTLKLTKVTYDTINKKGYAYVSGKFDNLKFEIPYDYSIIEYDNSEIEETPLKQTKNPRYPWLRPSTLGSIDTGKLGMKFDKLVEPFERNLYNGKYVKIKTQATEKLGVVKYTFSTDTITKNGVDRTYKNKKYKSVDDVIKDLNLNETYSKEFLDEFRNNYKNTKIALVSIKYDSNTRKATALIDAVYNTKETRKINRSNDISKSRELKVPYDQDLVDAVMIKPEVKPTEKDISKVEEVALNGINVLEVDGIKGFMDWFKNSVNTNYVQFKLLLESHGFDKIEGSDIEVKNIIKHFYEGEILRILANETTKTPQEFADEYLEDVYEELKLLDSLTLVNMPYVSNKTQYVEITDVNAKKIVHGVDYSSEIGKYYYINEGKISIKTAEEVIKNYVRKRKTKLNSELKKINDLIILKVSKLNKPTQFETKTVDGGIYKEVNNSLGTKYSNPSDISFFNTILEEIKESNKQAEIQAKKEEQNRKEEERIRMEIERDKIISERDAEMQKIKDEIYQLEKEKSELNLTQEVSGLSEEEWNEYMSLEAKQEHDNSVEYQIEDLKESNKRLRNNIALRLKDVSTPDLDSRYYRGEIDTIEIPDDILEDIESDLALYRANKLAIRELERPRLDKNSSYQEQIDFVINNNVAYDSSLGDFTAEDLEEYNTLDELDELDENQTLRKQELLDKAKNKVVKHNAEFDGITLDDLFKLKKQSESLVKNSSESDLAINTRQFRDSVKPLELDAKVAYSSEKVSLVYDGVYASKMSDGAVKIHNIRLSNILNRFFENNVDSVIKLTDYEGNEISIDYDNYEDVAEEYDNKSGFIIELSENESIGRAESDNLKTGSPLVYNGDLTLVGLLPQSIAGQATGYDLVYEIDAQGSLSPLESDFDVTIDDVPIVFNRDIINNIEEGDVLTLEFLEEADYNKTLSEDELLDSGVIVIKKGEDYVGILKDSTNYEDLREVRKVVMDNHNNKNVTISVDKAYLGLPNITFERDGSITTHSANGYKSYGYISESGEVIFHSSEIEDIDIRYISSEIYKGQKVPFVVVEHGVHKVAFPVILESRDSFDTTEITKIINSDMNASNKTIALNSLLSSYGLYTEDLMVTLNNVEDSVHINKVIKEISTKMKKVDITNMDDFRQSDKRILLNPADPFRSSKFRLNLDSVNGEVKEVSVESNVITTTVSKEASENAEENKCNA